MIKKKILLILSLISIAVTSAMAQQMTVIVSPQVPVGQNFAVTYRLTGATDGKIDAAKIQGCQFIYGPAISSMSSYSATSRGVTSSSTVEYTYTYKALKEGTYTVPAGVATVNGKRVSSSTRQIKVVSASNAPGSQASQQPRGVQFDDPFTQSADRPVGSNDLFVKIILNKSTAYEQEAIECTIKLFTKYGIESFIATKQPSFDGFLIQEVDFNQPVVQTETYNGQRYMTALLKKCIIFPQKSGRLTINSGNYNLDVIQYDKVDFGIFQSVAPRSRTIQVNSNSASIDIKPLPEPKPANFSGAVGRFSADARLVGNSFKTNDPGTYILNISGSGNIKYLTAPDIKFPSEFEMYTPKTDIKAEVAGATVSGTFKVDYTFIPQSVGDFEIQPAEFVYFDPSTGRYETIKLPGKKMHVAKGLDAPASKTKASKLTDILPIIENDDTSDFDHTPVILTFGYWVVYIILTLGLVAVIIIYRRNIKRSSDIIGRRLAKAGKVARRRLKRANGYMLRHDSDKFYEEMLRAMWGYLSDKLVIPVSQLNRDNIQTELTKYGADEQLQSSIISILDDCEMARYTPESSSQLNAVYDRAAAAIDSMENIKINNQ